MASPATTRAGWRDDQSVQERRLDAGRFDRHRGRWFLQLHQPRPGHVHVQEVVPAGSPKPAECIERSHRRGPQRQNVSGNQLRRLPEHLDQRHQVQRHHRQWLHRRRHRLGRRDDQSVSERRRAAGRFDCHRRRWFLQLHATSAPARTRCRKSFRPARRKPVAMPATRSSPPAALIPPATTSTTSRTSRSAAPSSTTSPAMASRGDDVGQGGVTVNLYLNGGSTPVASTVTAADGSYSFTNLGPGTYRCRKWFRPARRKPAATAATRSSPPAARIPPATTSTTSRTSRSAAPSSTTSPATASPAMTPAWAA